MAKTKLTADGDFLVREDVTLNYVVATILLTVFAISSAVGDYGWGNYLSSISLFVIPAAFFIVRARRNATSIKINKSGFYYAGKLVTEWGNFIDAVIEQKLIPGSIQDNFIILIRFYESAQVYSMTVPLSNTQDKSEEEIIEAIDFYYKASKQVSV